MNGNNHLLQKVIFEIGLNSQNGAFEIQNRFSKVFRSAVLTKLEEIFDSRVGPDKVVCITKLEIDLGNILSERLEADVETSLIKEMDDFLSLLSVELKNHNANNRSDTVRSRSINIRWSVPGKPHFEADVKVSDHSTSHFERIIRFLQSGVFIPGSGAGDNGKISTLINSVLENCPEEFVRFLRNNRQRSHIFQRLAINLEPSQLMYVASLLGCPFSGVLADRVRELALYLKQEKIEVRSFSLPGSVFFADAEQFIWWLVLVKYSGGLPPAAGFHSGSGNSHTNSSAERGKGTIPEVLAEIILVTKLLSKRSDFPVIGKRTPKRAYKIPPDITNALELLKSYVGNDGEEANQKTPSDLAPGNSAENVLFKDTATLAENTLFTMPEKKSPAFELAQNEEIPEAETGIYINNAGLILLAPFLKPFFTRLGLLEGKSFISVESQWKAVHILDYACGFHVSTEEEERGEVAFVFNKLLCGLNPHDVVPEELELSEAEREETDELLRSVLHHWTIMSSSSVFALQSTFLQKHGRLSISGTDWDLLIERDSAVEILIDKLPWSISLVKLPWNDYTIQTQW